MRTAAVFVLTYLLALACLIALTEWPRMNAFLIVALTVPAIVATIIVVEWRSMGSPWFERRAK